MVRLSRSEIAKYVAASISVSRPYRFRPYRFPGRVIVCPDALFPLIIGGLLCYTVSGCHRHPSAHRLQVPHAQVVSQPVAPPTLPTAADLSRALADERRAPSDAGTHYALARIYIGLGRAREGEAELVSATRLNPRFVPAFRALQRYYSLAGSLDREIETLHALHQLEPQRVENYVRLGQIFLRLYWLNAADTCLKQALQLAPADPGVNLAMAKCEWQMGRSADAVARLKKAHEVSPDDSETTSFLAQYLLATEHAPEAETILREGLKRHPGDRLLTITLIYNLVHQGGDARCREVVDLCRQFFQSYGPIAEVYCWLGRAYDQLQMTSDAVTAYQNAVRLDPSFENSTYLLGRHSIHSGRIKEGQRLINFYTEISAHLRTYVHAEETLRTQMESPDAHLAVAQLDLLSHYNPEAVVEFRRVLELRPGDSAARAGLRKALAASGRNDEATVLQSHHSLSETFK